MKNKIDKLILSEKFDFIIILFIVLGFIFVIIKIDKTNCEKNGGVYIWSFNKYETKCHLGGNK